MTLFDLDFDFDLFFYPTCEFYDFFNIKKERISYIHIATAGGHIPNYVYNNSFNHIVRHELKNQAELNSEVEINPNIESILGLSLDKDLDTDTKLSLNIYTYDFCRYAKRNCFSFDRTHISEPLINQYHLVAAPLDKNQDNRIPNHTYHFSFRRSQRSIFLVLESFYDLSSEIKKIFLPFIVIGHSPFNYPK